MPQSCLTCKHWTDETPALKGEDPGESLGSCHAMDSTPLPFAWRWAPREVVWTRGDEGETCPAFAR